MARAEQPTLATMPFSEIGLFVRTRSLAGVDDTIVRNEHKLTLFDLERNDTIFADRVHSRYGRPSV